MLGRPGNYGRRGTVSIGLRLIWAALSPDPVRLIGTGLVGTGLALTIR
jgi:hypothetical protein